MNWLLYVVIIITVDSEAPFRNEITLPVESEAKCKKLEETINIDAKLSWTQNIKVKVDSHCFRHVPPSSDTEDTEDENI